jgi:threonyl-tRNA synthetase
MDIQTIRHSIAHILAYAIQELYPGVKFGIGPAIDDGFYYDFALPAETSGEGGIITLNDLPKIENKMRELIGQNLKFEKREVSKIEAKKLFKDQPYKLELIKEIKEKKVGVYQTGEFSDLCKGPHIASTAEINPDGFKLTKVAGAYWKGSEKNPMLLRIYGLAYENKEKLDGFLKAQEEAERRDHRVIGKKLDLFIFSDLVGKGLPLYTEKGAAIKRELEKFVVDEEIKRGYKHICTPELARVELYKTSGHYPYYKNTMYPAMKIDQDELILRPMSCPHHFQIYSSRPRSYKELPFRMAELAKLFRYEKSGELTGLMRLRSFCLADSHIICQKASAQNEINEVLNLIEYCCSVLGFEQGKDYRYRLSLGDREDKKKYFKDDASWDFAENVLRQTLSLRKVDFFEAKNEAAFYGPKIDIQMKNFSGKEDTAFTVQYDFVMSKRFNLLYTDKDGLEKEPIVIHRSSIGAIERTMALLIEKYEGAFPLWLSPIQLCVIPISDKHHIYAKEIFDRLIQDGFRCELKSENETMSKKIRDGEMQKIPYLLVVGDREIEEKAVSVRQRSKGNTGMIKFDEFIKKIKLEREEKK